MEDAVGDDRPREPLTLLRGLDVFRGLREELLKELAAGMREIRLPAGEVLFRQGEPASSMFVIAEGRLAVTISMRATGETFRGEVRDGVPLIGETHAFSSGPRFATVSAAVDTRLYEISTAIVQRVARAAPELVARIGEIAGNRLRALRLYVALQKLFPQLSEPDVQALQRRIDWVYLQPGERLFAQGDPSDTVYIVIAGDLFVTREEGGEIRVVNTVSPGELVGEIGFFTGEPRSMSLYSCRDSELVAASRAAFAELLEKFPPLMGFVVQTLIRRVKSKERMPRVTVSAGYSASRARPGSRPRARLSAMRRETRTVAVIPLGNDLPLARFVENLAAALAPSGAVLSLDASRVEGLLGIAGISRIPPAHPHATFLTSSLGQAESVHRFVVYVADPAPTGWTRWCLRRADRILLLGAAGTPAALSETEEALLGDERSVLAPRQTLVLLGAGAPGLTAGTRSWLERRDVDDHLHVGLDRKTDFERLARSLTGGTIGLVLSGGGARGCAHIGVLRALEEAGVPIDVVGGTSIGAMVGALHARGLPAREVLEINRAMWIRNRPFQKFTVPVVSLLSERRIDELYQRFFGEAQIEDLPVSFFCVSSDLTTANMVVHRDGPLWRAVRSSSALPGIMVPTIADGSLLVDGAMVNNLPADVMREIGSGVTIVVNVGPSEGTRVTRERYPSPFELIGDRILRRRVEEKLPTIVEILTRSTLLSSASSARSAREEADLYLQPPVQRFGLLDFTELEAIAEAGYRHAAEELRKAPLPALRRGSG